LAISDLPDERAAATYSCQLVVTSQQAAGEDAISRNGKADKRQCYRSRNFRNQWSVSALISMINFHAR
jgi:hypothetical protein